MNNVNSIVICRDKFDSDAEFKNAIKDAISVLLENDYIMTVRYDDRGLGIVVIDYDSADRKLGGVYPYWLLPEEWESLYFDRQENEEE